MRWELLNARATAVASILSTRFKIVSANADIGDAVETGVKDLIEEVDDFVTWDAVGKLLYTNWQSHNTTFAFWMGINDIGNCFLARR
ncbi:hypothetical protein CPB86DRAFT_819319 [Serendipita vermifera]|nr:hypothetical protein CPB86DRAFT_819319 [Serendipita vermifera]